MPIKSCDFNRGLMTLSFWCYTVQITRSSLLKLKKIAFVLQCDQLLVTNVIIIIIIIDTFLQCTLSFFAEGEVLICCQLV